MSGSTLDAMASAVENSVAVIVCFSEAYKESLSCRQEAEYAFREEKPIIPIRVEKDYRAEGWLGLLLGTKLYVDCPVEKSLDSAIPMLIKQLGNLGKKKAKKSRESNESGIGSAIDSEHSTVDSGIASDQDRILLNWTSSEIKNWLIKNRAENLTEFLKEFDGQLLLQLKEMLNVSPTTFYVCLKEDMGISSLIDRLRLTKLIKEL